jgi:hypothetical protein
MKQNIRYVGFASGVKGSRVLEFSIEGSGYEASMVKFDVPAVFFSGEDRILLQEAAGICYAKLRALLMEDSAVPSHFLLSSMDIYNYRVLPPPRYRTAKYRPS